MVVVSLESGKVVEGRLKPSSDTATHLVLYRAFPGIGGIVHTHSLYATAWAQASSDLPSFGTTQADYCYGDVPCTRAAHGGEIRSDYEANTGHVIVERFRKLDPLEHPAVLVASHGPFAWGKDVADAVHNAEVLEYVARLASETLRINPALKPVQPALLDKHFLRKHGAKATMASLDAPAAPAPEPGEDANDARGVLPLLLWRRGSGRGGPASFRMLRFVPTFQRVAASIDGSAVWGRRVLYKCTAWSTARRAPALVLNSPPNPYSLLRMPFIRSASAFSAQ